MTTDLVKNNFIEAAQILAQFIENEDNFMRIQQAGDFIVAAILRKNKIFSCGNGGSMCDAMHFAEEFTGQFRHSRIPIPAIAIADPSHITCTANDYGFESIFSRYIEGLGQEGDILLAISTSGNSENVVKAATVAKSKGMKTIALTGKSGGKLAEICDIEIRAPYSEYSDRVQEIHIKIIHSLIHYTEQKLNESPELQILKIDNKQA